MSFIKNVIIDNTANPSRSVFFLYSTFKFILYVISAFGKNGYKRFDINFCKAKLLDLTIILESAEKPLSLQVIATINSISRQQKYIQRHCKIKCKKNWCAYCYCT